MVCPEPFPLFIIKIQIQLISDVETGNVSDHILRILTLNQGFLFLFMGIRHNLIGQAAYSIVLVYLHVSQLAVHKVSKCSLQTAHFQFRPCIVPPDTLYPLSRNILFERFQKQSRFAGLPRQLDHLIFRKLSSFKFLIEKTLHQSIYFRSQ